MDMRQFEQDHTLILEHIDELQQAIQQDRSCVEAICAKLRFLGSKVRLHLAVEDRFLYPSLIEARPVNVSRLAQQFQQEMGGLKSELEAFLSRYSTANDIRRDPSEFSRQCRQILSALHQRILREDDELYPLAGEL